ncbi:MAG: cytochrome c-type biogenesis protein [Acidimicrobiales bacterium]
MRSRFLFSWALMAVVLVAGLAVATFGSREPRTAEARMLAVAETIKCPTCRSQSVADSDAPASEAIRSEIVRRIDEGESDGEIRAYFASRYGEQILLTPRSSGTAGLVWALPIVALVVTGAGLGWAFVRWRRWET